MYPRAVIHGIRASPVSSFSTSISAPIPPRVDDQLGQLQGVLHYVSGQSGGVFCVRGGTRVPYA
jgi:hypothetical protein